MGLGTPRRRFVGGGRGPRRLSYQHNSLKAEPPAQVIDAYRDVQTSKADKEREINKAQAYLPRSFELYKMIDKYLLGFLDIERLPIDCNGRIVSKIY